MALLPVAGIDLELDRRGSKTTGSRSRRDGVSVKPPDVEGVGTLQAGVVPGDPLEVLAVASFTGEGDGGT